VILAGVWTVTGRQLLPSGWTRNRDELVHRHDAIRALADEQNLKAGQPSEVSPPEVP
jgi:hypothetical protein